jgi:hypothetical protein
LLAVRIAERNRPAHGVAQIDLPFDEIFPRRRSGVLESAMKTFAPELSALMTILRSTGPVISVRRSCRSAGIEATSMICLADGLGRAQKIRQSARINFLLPLARRAKSFRALAEIRWPVAHEPQRLSVRMWESEISTAN